MFQIWTSIFPYTLSFNICNLCDLPPIVCTLYLCPSQKQTNCVCQSTINHVKNCLYDRLVNQIQMTLGGGIFPKKTNFNMRNPIQISTWRQFFWVNTHQFYKKKLKISLKNPISFKKSNLVSKFLLICRYTIKQT